MKKLFLCASADEVLNDIVKHLPKPPKDLKIAFIPTAAEVESGDLWWLKADRNKVKKLGFQVTEFTITGLNYDQIKEKIKQTDVIFVAGGNTFYLLDQAIKSGFDRVLKEEIENKIYIGSSAGSMIVGKRIDLVSTIDDQSKAPNLKSNGLGIIDIALLPHWGSSSFKEEYHQGFDSMYAESIKILPLSNSQYLFVQDDSYQLIQV